MDAFFDFKCTDSQINEHPQFDPAPRKILKYMWDISANTPQEFAGLESSPRKTTGRRERSPGAKSCP